MAIDYSRFKIITIVSLSLFFLVGLKEQGSPPARGKLDMKLRRVSGMCERHTGGPVFAVGSSSLCLWLGDLSEGPLGSGKSYRKSISRPTVIGLRDGHLLSKDQLEFFPEIGELDTRKEGICLPWAPEQLWWRLGAADSLWQEGQWSTCTKPGALWTGCAHGPTPSSHKALQALCA